MDSPGGSTSNNMEEVLVFGVKEPLSVQQVTTSADIFGADRVDRESLFELDDVLQRSPNVAGTLSRLTIRGIPSTSYLGGGATPSRGRT
ncbi:MAG: hypothetical protein AAGF46_03385, partial [Pseudomonadota bacterium]